MRTPSSTRYAAMYTPAPHLVPFVVSRKGKDTDRIFFAPTANAGDVRRTLIDRDGFPDDISVRRDA